LNISNYISAAAIYLPKHTSSQCLLIHHTRWLVSKELQAAKKATGSKPFNILQQGLAQIIQAVIGF